MGMDSLWGDAFVEPADNTQKILNKIKSPKKDVQTVKRGTSSKVSFEEKMQTIKSEVYRILGRYTSDTLVIKTREQFHSYIDAAIQNGVIAIDTETNNSLEPESCKLMGPCIYTPGQKNAYIPINHVNPYTEERLSWQLTEQDVFEEFSRLNNTKIITHNGKFDYEVLICTTGYKMPIYWDTMIGAKVLNENEKASLKSQYIEKIDPTVEKYSIEHLFAKMEYAVVDPDLFALYAATDSYMTYRLYEWQTLQFNMPGNEKLYQLYRNVELPIIEVAANMELTGVTIDTEYSKTLSEKYHKQLADLDVKISDELAKYDDVINEWRCSKKANFRPFNKKGEPGKSKAEQLENPVNITSPTQLAILLYDVLGLEPVDKEFPRGTGEDILKKLDLPLCNLILEERTLLKLLGTYIDKLPACVCKTTGKLHASFNQYGTDTGRFSSSDPNLQNIPSHNKEIRLMFKASDGYALVGSDYSQQEPRLLAAYAHDENMIGAYKAGKDLYASIASQIYHNKYEDNLEHHADGTLYADGKKRRGSVKGLLLGILYGMGAASIAITIGSTVPEAQNIIDTFYHEFPKVRRWMDESLEFARANGYVEDMWGRRRRLPDMMMNKFDIIDKDEKSTNIFNPILGAVGRTKANKSSKVSKYESMLKDVKTKKDSDRVKALALKDGITIIDNSGKISRSERQCVNARVQGGAATLSKMAMIAVHNDQVLKDLGFRLLIAVHDELIGECPQENAQAAADRLSYIMIEAAREKCETPMKCDAEITHRWYENDYLDIVKQELEKMATYGKDMNECIDEMYKIRPESKIFNLKEIL